MFRNLLAKRFTSRMESAVELITRRSRTAVLDRLSPQVQSMVPAEARGYVRARAAWVVCREVDRAVARGEIQASALGVVVKQSVSRVTEEALAEAIGGCRSAARSRRRDVHSAELVLPG